MHLDALCQTLQAIAAWLERIFPNSPPAVQAIFDYSYAMIQARQFIFEDTGPTLVQGQPLTCVRNDSPSERISVDKNLPQRTPQETVYPLGARTSGLTG